jgi:diaminopimelate decarboxylase
MDAIVIEHVKVSELPESWRAKLGAAREARVTVRIEAETETSGAQAPKQGEDNPLFGMWRDREDMADVEAYVRQLRAPRF